MKRNLKAGVLVAIGSIMLIVSGCLPSALSVNAARRTQPTFNGNAWVTYWDFDQGLKEAVAIQTQLNSVSYFAAAFDKHNKIIMMGPVAKFTGKQFARYRAEVKKYLTVVNDVYKDVHNPAGESIEKDIDVLSELFRSDDRIRAHVADLLNAVKKNGFDGLEIDYENIWKYPITARRYVKFLEILVPEAEKAGIPLRVILEPGIPVASYELPEGPEYILMCYNLFGSHSAEAGPKADDRFLDKMLLKVKQLPRPHGVALATGGCVWQEGKRPYFVTEQEALALQKTLKASLHRDPFSAAQHFNGRNAEGKKVECWFADAKTIITWKRQVMDSGVDGISLWRLGGNHKIEEYYPGIINNK
jgi:hypothetical protein